CVAQVKPVLGRDELARSVHHGDGAGHAAERMRFRSAAGTMLHQQAVDDVEPVERIRRRIVARSLAELAHGVRKRRDGRLAHDLLPKRASQAAAAARASAATSATVMPGLNRLDPSPKTLTPAAL